MGGFTDWFAIYRCKICKKELTYKGKMDSHGVCPCCGHISGDTMCDTETGARRNKTSAGYQHDGETKWENK